MKFFFTFLLVFFSYTSTFAQNHQSVLPAIKGVQVFVLDEIYKDDLGQFFKEVKSQGVDTVFFRVFHNLSDRPHLNIPLACNSGVYFKTNALCTVEDLLAPVVKLAKENNIKIYAWMATRSLTELKEKHPMLALSASGGLEAGYGANIFKSDVRRTITQLFRDLAKYDIDGILFQDDFIIKYTEGADTLSAALFFADTNLRVDGATFFESIKKYNGKKIFSGFKDEFYIWAKWKSRYLASFFKELKDVAKSVNPDILFAANIYYETPLYAEKGLAWYSQNIPLLLDNGADYLAVMGYHEQIATELNKAPYETATMIGEIAKSSVALAGGNAERVIMKLQGASFTKRPFIIHDFHLVCREISKIDNISIALVPVNSSKNIMKCE